MKQLEAVEAAAEDSMDMEFYHPLLRILMENAEEIGMDADSVDFNMMEPVNALANASLAFAIVVGLYAGVTQNWLGIALSVALLYHTGVCHKKQADNVTAFFQDFVRFRLLEVLVALDIEAPVPEPDMRLYTKQGRKEIVARLDALGQGDTKLANYIHSGTFSEVTGIGVAYSLMGELLTTDRHVLNWFEERETNLAHLYVILQDPRLRCRPPRRTPKKKR